MERFDVQRPKGRNFRWVIVSVIAVLAMTNYMDRGNLSVAAPLIMHDLHIGNTQMGIILSAFVWPYAIMNLPGGWAVDRFGAKLPLALAAGFWSLLAAMTGFARSASSFVALRAGLGVCEAPLFPAALKATSAWFPDVEKARATSVYIAATQVGLALAPPVSTFLMLHYGWPAMFLIMGAVGALALIGWLALYGEPEQVRRLHPEELRYIREGQSSTLSLVEPKLSLRDWLALFRYAAMWQLMFAAFCLQYVFWFYITWMPTYLQAARGIELRRAGILAMLPYLAGGVAVVLGGKISDSLIHRGMTPFAARRSVIAVAALLTAMTMVATAFSKDRNLAVALLTLGMFTYSLSSAPFWALASEMARTPNSVASIGSIQNFGGFLGGACAPILTGVAVDHLGGFVPALLVTGGTALIAAVMYGAVLRRQLPI